MAGTDRIVDTARDVSQRLHGSLGDAFEVTRDALGNGLRAARVTHGGRVLRNGRTQVQERVSDSPFLALLIAGAVGYGLALFVHRDR